MNGMLEFYIKMKDLMSSGLTKLTQNSKKAFASIQSDIDKTVAQNKKLADSFDEVDRKAASGGGGVLAWGKRIAAGVGIAALVAGGAFAKSSAQAYMNYEKQSKSFEVLAGNKGVGQSLAGGLNKLQQDTILGPEVFKNAQTMMGFGITADKVIPNMKMLGEVSMGDAEKLGSLTLAFSQVSAAGKLSGQDLLQFINAGFNPLHEISVMTGKSMGDLKKEMEKGNITFDMVSKSFEHATGKGGLFNGMLDTMAETTSGKMAQLQGSVEGLKIAVGERMKGPMNAFIGGLTSVVGWAKKFFEIPLERKIDEQVNAIRGLQVELTSSNTNHERQVQILRELEQINPNIVKGISDQSIEYGKLATNINNVVNGLQNQKMAEIINKQNAGLLSEVAMYKTKQGDDRNNLISLLGQVGDPRMNDLTIPFGQKQVLAQQILMARVKKQGNNFSLSATPDALLLNRIQGAISDYHTSQGFLDYNAGKVKGVQDQISTASKIYEQMAGFKSMSTASIKGSGNTGGGGSTIGGGGTGNSVAGGITGGGPRVININGVKFTDKIEIHTTTPGEGIDQLEHKFEEMFLRVLNSGASIN